MKASISKSPRPLPKSDSITIRTKVEGKTAWDRMPFVGKDHGKHETNWDVPLSGGYFGGIEVGQVAARLYLKYLRDERESPLRMGSSHLESVLRDLYRKTASTQQEEESLRGQRVGFVSELGHWLEHAAERAGSCLDAIPQRSFVQQANESLAKNDAALVAAIELRSAQ